MLLQKENFPKMKKKRNDLEADIKSNISKIISNHSRRLYYARSELLKFEIGDMIKDTESDSFIDESLAFLNGVSEEMKLSFVSRPCSSILVFILDKIDELTRFLGVWSCIVVSAVFLAIPCILIKPLDYFLLYRGIITPFQQISVLAKRFIAGSIILLSGISLVTEDMDLTYFGSSCVLTCFSHSSTMDAFILSYVVPTRHFTVSKQDLFLIPYFAWLLIAFDGVPIDRSNVQTAALSLTSAAESAQQGDCLCMAPEGTRSVTGQLIPFKKGPFYVWEKLQTDIVPIVVFGAFELYPPGKQMSIPGRVYARVLPPIPASAATTREGMARILRVKMLEAVLEAPQEAGQELNWTERGKNIAGLIVMFTTDYFLYRFSSIFLFEYLGLSVRTACLSIGGSTILTTAILYLFATRRFSRKSKKSKIA
mmetsp:Transcript_27841/g.26672  ORF Transcript_27841/g.26672 Transcript_27841/m.26672 type:complete len:424 (+) Transcript_27841:111-1382(+)